MIGGYAGDRHTQAPTPVPETQLPPKPAMIAPGVERTGNEAYDEYLDWMYNSGEVELVGEES